MITDDTWIYYIIALWEFHGNNFSRPFDYYVEKLMKNGGHGSKSNKISITETSWSNIFNKHIINVSKNYEVVDEKGQSKLLRSYIDSWLNYLSENNNFIYKIKIGDISMETTMSDGMSIPMNESYIKYMLEMVHFSRTHL